MDQAENSGAKPPNYQIPISPVATAVDIGIATLGNDERVVVLSVSTATGIQHYFFEEEHAVAIAKSIQRQSRDISTWKAATRRKLIVP